MIINYTGERTDPTPRIREQRHPRCPRRRVDVDLRSGLDESSPGLALGTLQGVVKRVVPDYPANRDESEVITLKDGDRIVGGAELRTGEEDPVFVTSDAQLLRYQASHVRPQGRAAGGVAGIKLPDGAEVISFTAVDPAGDAVDFTIASSQGTLDDSVTTSKLTPFDQYPRKGGPRAGWCVPALPQGETSRSETIVTGA
jgi:DNA gyrase subunit A